MNKEEKEAIEYLDMMENKINFDLLGYVYGNETIDTVLNLIQKQDKIINDIKFITYNNKPHITQEKLIEYFI